MSRNCFSVCILQQQSQKASIMIYEPQLFFCLYTSATITKLNPRKLIHILIAATSDAVLQILMLINSPIQDLWDIKITIFLNKLASG